MFAAARGRCRQVVEVQAGPEVAGGRGQEGVEVAPEAGGERRGVAVDGGVRGEDGHGPVELVQAHRGPRVRRARGHLADLPGDRRVASSGSSASVRYACARPSAASVTNTGCKLEKLGAARQPTPSPAPVRVTGRALGPRVRPGQVAGDAVRAFVLAGRSGMTVAGRERVHEQQVAVDLCRRQSRPGVVPAERLVPERVEVDAAGGRRARGSPVRRAPVRLPPAGTRARRRRRPAGAGSGTSRDLRGRTRGAVSTLPPSGRGAQRSREPSPATQGEVDRHPRGRRDQTQARRIGP